MRVGEKTSLYKSSLSLMKMANLLQVRKKAGFPRLQLSSETEEKSIPSRQLHIQSLQ